MDHTGFTDDDAAVPAGDEQMRADDARAGGRMALGALIISFFLFLGKVSGYARNMVMAGWFGGDARTDAFYKIYDTLTYGTYTNFEKFLRPAYLPQFVREKTDAGEAVAWQLSSVIANLAFVLVTLFTIALELFAPQIIRLAWRDLAADPANLTMATALLRVTAPTAIFLTLSLMPELTLHAYKRFTLAAIAEFLFRIMLVVGLVMGGFLLKDPAHPKPIMAAAVGVVLGSGLRFFGMLPGLWGKLKYYRLLLNPFRIPAARTVLALMPPILVGAIAAYARSWGDTVFTDRIGEGTYTYLKFARQMSDSSLQILPLAVSFVVFPFISEWAARGEKDKLAEALVSMTRIMAFLFVPMSVGLMFTARPVITIMYEHGEMTPEGAGLTALALFCYAPGLLFLCLESSINKWYFALQDTKTPNYWGAAMAVLNTAIGAFAVFFLFERGYIGQAGALAAVSLALTLTKSVKVLVLYALIRRRIGRIDPAQVLAFTLKLLAATAAMALVTYFIIHALEAPLATWQPGFLHKPSLVQKLRMMGLSTAVTLGGGGVFVITAALLRVEELAMIGGWLKKKIGGRLRR